MRIDTMQFVHDVAGNPLRIAEGDPLTLKKVIVDALYGPLKGDDALNGTQKVQLHLLAIKVFSEDVVDLPAGDIEQIKNRVGKAWGISVAGPALLMIDQPMAGGSYT